MLDKRGPSLAILVALMMLPLSGCWQGPPAKPYVKPSATDGGPEDPAIQAIEAAGGTCFRYHQIKNLLVERDSYWLQELKSNPVVCVDISDNPRPNKLLLEVAKLSHIQSLCITRSPVSDAGAAIISKLETLRSLRIENANLTSQGISDIAKLKLEYLNFASNRIGDKGIEIVSTITDLKELHLGDSAASDSGYAHLANLKDLKYLVIGRTNLSDAGLAPLANLKNLKEMSVHVSNITGTGFQGFGNSNIRKLKLTHSKISPTGLSGISQIPHLQELDLFCSSVADAGLESLASMKRLQSLSLYDGSVTEKGLQKLLPSKSLRTIDVTGCNVTQAECQRFNDNSSSCRAIIIDD